jgi:SAM-dependent methyltransferase
MGAASQDASDLPSDGFVLLDPAVEILRTESTTFLCNTDLEVGMVIPRGEGILELLRSLAAPVHVGTLRDEYDRALIDGMLASLLTHGFIHISSPKPPSLDELTELRARTNQRRSRTLRAALDIDLEVSGAIDRWLPWRAGDFAPEVLLRVSRLAQHGAMLGELARRRKAGALRAHQVVVRCVDARCDEVTRDALLRLGAAVEIDGVPWPAPEQAVPGLAELTRHRIATHVIVRPDSSILDPQVRARAGAWVCQQAVSGLCVWLDPAVIWGKDAEVTEGAFIEALEAARSMEEHVGDVVVLGMPSDEVLLGNTSQLARDASELGRRLRRAYLRWRIPIIKTFEGDYVWPQVPEVESNWVRPEEDFLPNHPELLGLRAGSSIVDVCGGLGRVARRLAPAIGDGVIISVELRRVMSDRARRFACDQGFTNLQFRTGLAQRLPLPDASVDAAVNEWTGVIWSLGLGPVMLSEMARVVRPHGRISVTHRLLQLRLEQLDNPWVQYKDIYRLVRSAFERADLRIVAERVWGQVVPSIADETPTDWLEIYLPRLVTTGATLGTMLGLNPDEERATVVDVYLTLIAERLPVSPASA